MENQLPQEINLQQKIMEIDERLDKIYKSVETTRRYFKLTLIVTVLTVLLPLLGILISIPYMVNMMNSFGGVGGLNNLNNLNSLDTLKNFPLPSGFEDFQKLGL